jgi:hypothetical protein
MSEPAMSEPAMSEPVPGLLAGVSAAESPELAITFDLVKRGVIVAPVLIGVCALIWGTDGALSALYGIAIVLANFLLAASMMAVAARISPGVLMAVVLFGFLFRLGLVLLAVLLVRDASWISPAALGTTIIVTHLGLLIWELKYVNISLAFAGLKPANSTPARHSSHH